MQFATFSDFLNMGGYGFFVWSVFVVFLICFVALWLHTSFSRKKINEQIRKLNQLQKMKENSKKVQTS